MLDEPEEWTKLLSATNPAETLTFLEYVVLDEGLEICGSPELEEKKKKKQKTMRMVETRSGKMQDPAQERIKAEEFAKPQPGATIGGDASSDPVVLNPNIDIPKYDGTEDPRPWIESLEEIGFLYHWADYIISRYAAMNMIGSAKTWLNLHKISFTSWENFKSRLIEDFASDANKEEIKMKLNRMQQWNEPAIRFAEDILVLCNKVDPQMEEKTKINWVIGGLKKEYSFALHLNPPKNTNELLEICKKLDLFEKNYQERAEKSKALYNGPRSPRPHHQEQWKNATSFRRPYQNTSKPQAPAPRYYQNTSKPQTPTPRYYQDKPLPQVSAPRRSYTPNPEPKPVYPSKTYNKNPNSIRNRTEDGRPICFKCNKPGHVARYCRVKFIRILEEDPADTQEKVEEKCQMNEISEKSGPRLYADIGTFEALVDTGADLSVVDLRTALDTGHGISKLAKICAGPDGKKLDMVGSIFLNIKIDDETLSHNFVILKTHLRTLILGRDFLKKMNAKIDCKQETIKYDLTNNHDEINFEMLKIKSAKDSIVPECSMKLIKALVETEDGEYIIEESSKMFQTNGLRLARSLINVINRETHIWITNPYPRPLKIMKNQTLAFGSSPAKINVSREREVEENKEPRFQINENLSPKEQKELKQVLERYGDLFSSRLGRTNLAKHRIDTEDAKPIKHKPYRVSAKERDIIKEQIDEMLTEGIIRPSSSPWSFPVILVKKRDGKYRFCVDYRKLNNVTVKDVYPIPRIDEVMDTLQGSTHFSAIDLRSGYWQVEVEERDKEKTAFTTAHGLYEFNVMPFGLCNAPATFERNMENMLGNLRWQICLCYLDDVIIYSPDFPTHLKRLEAVFRCFRESNLRSNDKKCRFAFEELEILGYITSKHGIKPAEHNIKAVRNFPRPKKVKEVQSFLGMCSYYRKFIKDFSKIADPLTNLIKKSVSFIWTERQEEAFQTLKTALLSPPILGHFNPNAPTYVHTDASNIGIGATLVQDIGGEEKVISYLSRTLSKAEQNYSTTEKECLAVVWSMSKLRPYLYGRHFKIVTDHHALCWLKNLKDPTGRLARWALKIQEYDFDIIHKSGKKHLDADGLSRGPLPETDWDEDFERLFLNQITDEEDKFIESVKKNLNGSRRSIAQNFKVEDGCLFKKNPNPEGRAWLLVVPEKKKREIMKEYHNHMSNGHLGVARTMYRIKNDLEQYFKEKSALAKKLNLDKTLLLEALTDGMPDHLKKYLIAARVQEPSEWYKITTQLKLSTNKEEEPQQPSTSTSTPVKKFNSNSSKAHQYQPFPRTAAATHHQQEPHKSINQPPYPCKICASHQLPNQIHFHRDCPLKNNNHPKRINPGRTLLLFSVFINQISLPCVLDTASSISIIPLKYLNHIYYKILDNSPKERIGQVEGFTYPLYKILVRLSLGKITKYQEMFVCDSPIEYLILGLPTFYIFKLQIDFSKNLLFQNYKFLYSFNPKTDNQESYATTLCIPDPYYVKNSSLLNINPLCNFNSFDIPTTNVKLIDPNSNPIIDSNPFHSMRQPGSITNYNSYLDLSKVDINPNFSNQTISDILHKYKNVFSKHNFDIGYIKTNPICISLLDNIPISQKPYRTSFYNNAEIQKQITELLKYDIIRPSSSPYSSPALLVNKKSDAPNHPTRLCIDYRKLNQKTVPEHTPIPLIEQIIDRLSQSKIYTILDVKNAYWHIPIDEKDRHKTSFVTQFGCYEWNRLPYGLKNAPSQFERIMKSVFTKHNIHYALNYFDDIIIHSKTYEEHIKHLDDILGIFKQEDIKLNLNKCKFLQKEIQFLGYTINSGKYTPNNTNIEAILKLNRPYNIKTLQRFLGTINIYNKFIPHYAQIRAPLNELLLKNAPWLWSEKHEQAFQTLKNSLISQPVLYIYDPSKPCHLFTDASSLGVAGVLKQPDEQGILHPIGYFSRKLHPYEQNYTASEIETLAIINSVQRFHTYLHNIHFTLHTDHLPLKWIKNVKNPQGRLFRWSLILSQYSFDIKHIKGLNNIEADMLSRAPVSFYLTYNDLKEHQSTEQISSAKIKIQNGLYIINRKGFKRAYVPQTLRHKLLSKVHTKHGHIGTTQMTKIISPHYYWPHMSRDIANYTKHCETCQFNKSRDNRIVYGPLQQMPIATHPNHIFSLDTLGGLHNYGTTRHSIHMIVDHHSRFLWAFPTKSVSTDSYITCLRNLFQINKPEILITDRNAAFLSRKFKHFLDRNNVKHLLTSSHHPETNSKVERLNSTIINRLRCEYNANLKIPWTKYIPKITESYNETVHTTTGFPPKFLYYGIQPHYIEHDTVTHTPIEKARKLAIERTIKSHEHSKQLYDIKHPELIFKEGDQVLVKTFIYPNTGKLTQRYIGPFTILKQLSPVTYEIDKPNIPQRKQTEIIHSNKLKLFYPETDFLLHYSTNIENDFI
ncbi:hypothetical protein LAZ67_16001480, partial [Cordylochernes scorpioides]